MIAWFDNTYDEKVLRNGSSWSEIEGFKEDTTRSGKTKRRMMASMGKRPVSVKMRLTYTQYTLFKTWYANTCKYGTLSFGYPRVDGTNRADIVEYRFATGGMPSYSNPTGKYIDVSMKWEEV